jgi:adenylate cyclase
VSPESFKRKLTAILSADVKGYSRLMGENEAETVKTLTAYRKVMGELIQQHRGRVIDSPGDNILAEFGSVVDAVKCAVKIQESLKGKNAELPENRRMEFRIGVNLGDVIEEEGRIYGDGVNIAARLEGLAEAGGICVSGTAFDQVDGKLELEFEYLGERSVKNIKKPVRVYQVKMERGVCDVEMRRELPLPDKPSIAVLPFVNMSDDPKQEFFSDGLTEDLITSLSKVPQIFVIARNSTFTYKSKSVKVQEVAKDLGVRYVLEGSVQRAGDLVRITAQLIDAQTGYHVWSERYDEEMSDLFALQDKIILEILKALDVKLTYGEAGRIHGKGTSNLDAYLKFLQARDFVVQVNRESNFKARQLAEEVIALDPQFPTGYSTLATITFLDVRLGISKSPMESLMKAIELEKKAISLDDSHASAHAHLGYLYAQIGEHEKGVEEGERAIEKAPNLADAHAYFALALNCLGRPEEAIKHNMIAFRLNPLSPPFYYYTGTAHAYRLTGRYGDAVKMCTEVLSRWPTNVFGYVELLMTYMANGRDDEARALSQDLLRIDPKFSAQRYAQSIAYSDPALTTQALELMRKAGLPD